MSGLLKFKNRKKLSGQVEVKFLPSNLYTEYCQTHLAGGKTHSELTPEERLKAEETHHELTFTIKRLSEVEDQFRQREALISSREDLPTIEYLTYSKRKMVEHFVSAKHTPKDGSEPIQFTKELFAEFLDYLSLVEIVEFSSAYYAELRNDERQAEGNATAPLPAS